MDHLLESESFQATASVRRSRPARMIAVILAFRSKSKSPVMHVDEFTVLEVFCIVDPS